jgi:Mrp family chromosome partitioning ATPase
MCDGNCDGCSLKETCATGGVPQEMQQALQDIHDAMESVQHKILILSGKGGVGKSTFAYLLAKTLASTTTVSVLDLDLCGPSMPYLFGAPHYPLHETSFGFEPCYVGRNIGLVSIEFFLENQDDPVIARGPRKNSFILQFLKDVDWGESNVILVDTPPGTSDEHLSVVSFMAQAGIDGAVLVTTPEEVAISDVRREVKFCQKAGVKILGVIENMSAFTCPKCGAQSAIYPATTGGAAGLCEAEHIALLGRLPIEPTLVAGMAGSRYEIPAVIGVAMAEIVGNLNAVLTRHEDEAV